MRHPTSVAFDPRTPSRLLRASELGFERTVWRQVAALAIALLAVWGAVRLFFRTDPVAPGVFNP